ncbi:hypothetical protein HH310_18230 [Actinoplanes sp. TBRC 11911]|uniref:hypothetical protein n=1 Tax=Actinoplanes sp. TBRC 11911 TaxID=2729386 RepID=UPI00145F0787|nr:hypothetical protein [Actinoplanes sp. TBRC 11911]NMO53121.1 hypothetical protein [Actinoplanes sp. TBRC 11911]
MLGSTADSLGAGCDDPPADGPAEVGVGMGTAGAVGVGTGTFSPQAQSRFVVFVSFFAMTGLGAARPGVISVGAGTRSTAPIVLAGRTTRLRAGPCPTRASDVVEAGGAGGSVSAAAGRSGVTDPRPFTTPRYAVAAPATVSTPNTLAVNARRGRRTGTAGCSVNVTIEIPNVLIPVLVTSGPPAGGSTGRRPKSYRSDRQAPATSVRAFRSRLIGFFLQSSGTL